MVDLWRASLSNVIISHQEVLDRRHSYINGEEGTPRWLQKKIGVLSRGG